MRIWYRRRYILLQVQLRQQDIHTRHVKAERLLPFLFRTTAAIIVPSASTKKNIPIQKAFRQKRYARALKWWIRLPRIVIMFLPVANRLQIWILYRWCSIRFRKRTKCISIRRCRFLNSRRKMTSLILQNTIRIRLHASTYPGICSITS